jgi:nitrogen regulatory protein PII
MEDIQEALDKAGVLGMTVTEVNGVGRQKGDTQTCNIT